MHLGADKDRAGIVPSKAQQRTKRLQSADCRLHASLKPLILSLIDHRLDYCETYNNCGILLTTVSNISDDNNYHPHLVSNTR